MRSRVGLQARMTISFVVATVAIVMFVEILAGVIVLPRIATGQDSTVRAFDAATEMAKRIADAAGPSGALPTASTDLSGKFGSGTDSVSIPKLDKASASGQHVEPLALVLDPTGRITSSTYPAGYPVGDDATQLLPPDAQEQLHTGLHPDNPKLGAAAVAVLPGGKAVWALVAIRVPASAASPDSATTKQGPPLTTIGYAYVQLPAIKGYVLAHRLSAAATVLLLALPVGIVFGLATTRGLRRRLLRLADASQAVAGGDFTTRVDPSSTDEVGRLERNFNEMTTRLGAASDRELELASQNARLAERTRISRELHDSISQDLFSLALLSGGLQRALPGDSPLQAQVQQISDTVATALHEMRALVLDLHPSALSEKGLNAAIEDLCASLRNRLALDVGTHLETVELDVAAQHALLRVAQESLTNASRHADAGSISVELRSIPGGVELAVTDDGHGFDPSVADASSGVGLRLMRERMAEIGGELTVESRAGGGTTVRARLVVSVPASVPQVPASLAPDGSP